METFEGYLVSGLIGISLGLIDGGGSIITIPVLVYLFHIDPPSQQHTSYLLSAPPHFVGGILSVMNRMVDFKLDGGLYHVLKK